MDNNPTTLEKAATTMVPASTEISRDASAKVEALATKDDRSRAYVLRQIIHEWADRQPASKKAK